MLIFIVRSGATIIYAQGTLKHLHKSKREGQDQGVSKVELILSSSLYSEPLPTPCVLASSLSYLLLGKAKSTTVSPLTRMVVTLLGSHSQCVS